MKRWLRIGGIAFAILLLILIVLPFVINVNRFRPKVESEASAALGRQVTVGDLSLSLLSGTVRADNIAIADDPAFSKSPFVTAQSLKVGVEILPLLSSKFNVTYITLEQPQITLVKTASGKWNFSSIGGASAKKAPEAAKSGSPPPSVSVAKLNIDHGKLSVGTVNSQAKPVVFDNVNITVSNFSFNSEFPFQLTAQLPRGGDANVSGKAGPINPEDASQTPFQTTVKVNNMSIGALGMLDPATGIAGQANFDGTLTSNGSEAKAVGLFTGRQLKFSPKGTPGPKVVTIKHSVDYDLDKQTGTIKQGDVAIGNAQAHLTGTFQAQGDTEVVNLKLNAPNMPVDELEPMLPSLGVVVPQGSQLKGGTLSAELGIAGPIDRLVITGPVRLSNTQLANFDLGSKLGALSAFTGKTASSRDTSIQNASLNARVAPEGTTADNIAVNIPALGDMTGNGTISPEGALNFKMLANLQGGVVSGLTKVAGVSSGPNGIAFAIQGTTSAPRFVPDVGGIATSLARGAVGDLA